MATNAIIIKKKSPGYVEICLNLRDWSLRSNTFKGKSLLHDVKVITTRINKCNIKLRTRGKS